MEDCNLLGMGEFILFDHTGSAASQPFAAPL